MISVISTVYNGEKYFDKAIPSILAQDYQDFEYIIVDDGSTDGTLRKLEELAKKDSRIKVFAPGRLGRAKALNFAVSKARGEYIAQQDFDDVSYPNRLSVQASYLYNYKDIGWVGCWYDVEDSISGHSFTRKVPLYHKEITKYCARAIPFAHTLVMFRKKAWEEAGGYPLYDDIEDLRLCINIASSGYQIVNAGISLGIHYVHPNSFWHTNFKYTDRQRNLSLAQRKAIAELHLPKWMYIYPVGRSIYSRLGPSIRTIVRRFLGGSKEQDIKNNKKESNKNSKTQEIRIALYLVQLNGGGVEKLMETLAKGLAKNYSALDVIVCNKMNNHFDKGDNNNIFVHDLECNTGYGEMYAITSLFKLIKILNNKKIDTLLAGPGYCGVIAILASIFSKSKTKIIPIIDSKITLLKRGRWYHKILYLLLKFLLKYSSEIIVAYNKIKEDILSKVLICTQKINVIPHPVVDDNLFEKSNIPMKNIYPDIKDKAKFLYVGRINQEKGLFVLLEAFLKVIKVQPSVLFIVGSGDQIDDIIKWVDYYDMANHIKVLGYQKNPYIYYKMCDVLVLPSYIEAFGIVLVEALALGCPVVATNTESEGPSSILDGGRYGMLCNVGDPLDLSRNMLACYKRDWNKDILRQRGMDYSVTYSINKYKQLLNLF